MTDRPEEPDATAGSVRYVDPEGSTRTRRSPTWWSSRGPTRTVYVGGQDSVDASGNIVGKGDVAAQTEQVLANVRAALARRGRGARARNQVEPARGRRGIPAGGGFPPFNARGSPRRTRRRSPWLTSRGWRTRISWWRWTPSPSCLCEPRRGGATRSPSRKSPDGRSPWVCAVVAENSTQSPGVAAPRRARIRSPAA